MNIKYRQLKAFILAAEAGSFVAAARALSVTPSSFSALIKEMENDLGVELFERSTRKCQLTEAGRSLYDKVHGALEDIEAGYGHVHDIGQGSRGNLTFACLPSLAAGLAVGRLTRFNQQFPLVRVRLRERKHNELIQAVQDGGVEFGIGVLLRPDPDLEFDYLMSDHLCFVAPLEHPVNAEPPTWKCLEKFPYIYVGNGNTEHALTAARIRRPAAYEVEHVATALAMARQNLGLAVLPTSSINGLDTQGLSCIPIRGEASERRIGIIRRTGRPPRAAAREFIRILREDLPNPMQESAEHPHLTPHPAPGSSRTRN